MPRIFECPSCKADISESYQEAEPDVGIGAGWYCDRCCHGYPDEDGPELFGDEVGVHLDPSEYKGPQTGRCSKHPEAIPEMGYGLAGGGIGAYSYCPECGTVLSKSQDHS